MFGISSTPAKAEASDLELVSGHYAVAAHCSWIVRMNQMQKIHFLKETNKELLQLTYPLTVPLTLPSVALSTYSPLQ